ncbi:tRNA(Ile)-lysidine synthetase-like protein [Nitrobacter hamburgensis X14]|uniref:tRNA(Ile)-lysidine synthase n=1 Tax=Nitrobacter hamburgensis (strain DSM 10229 / NCIMB 13809 / X14) TaxID=323097 RepID=Q1QHR1_NITHX|nr:tRNA lysidine(34) synthetase TilS [Nitrobacter hamburgensis]ABE64236.1 tRNA(Ile)-lysidine synthetase-like protein [Nitrobacter hamburgensis X14]
MIEDDASPISATEAKLLFADWKAAHALVLGVSGGPDSTALMWLAARWRRAMTRGPDLIAVTVDHGLRPGSAREARDVKHLATSLGMRHRTVRWSGAKPKSGLPAAARDARYRLLAKTARANGALHVFTAHTRDDQAETVLMRISRGSGITGLSAMARETMRDGFILARPLLHVSKSRLIATLEKAGIAYAEDPTNRDVSFTRPRLRALMPALAEEGCDVRNLARLASRLARANTALELLADGAERYLALQDRGAPRPGFQTKAFAALSEEIKVRLLLRAIDRVGCEGPAELGKVETLLGALDRVAADNGGHGRRILLRRTLAGALVTLTSERISVEPAPPRRRTG